VTTSRPSPPSDAVQRCLEILDDLSLDVGSVADQRVVRDALDRIVAGVRSVAGPAR